MRYEQSIRDTFTVTGLSGDEFLAMCPWHDDSSQGHLYINGTKGLYLCMSCGAKGSLDSLSLPRIIVGTDDVRERIARFRTPRKEQRYHPESWLTQFDVPHDYWYEERTVALVEGQVDACRGWASRVPALSLMGARITRDQIKVLQRLNIRNVVLMMDNDAAGVRGTVQIHEAMMGSGIRVKAGWYRDYWNVKDPDGLSPQRYRKMYHSALPVTEWAARVA